MGFLFPLENPILMPHKARHLGWGAYGPVRVTHAEQSQRFTRHAYLKVAEVVSDRRVVSR